MRRIAWMIVGIALVACSDDTTGGAAGKLPDGGTSSNTSSGGSDPGSNPGIGTLPTDPSKVPAPTATCDSTVVAADSSHPDVVVGGPGGPPCTEAGLQTALDHGGVITFACGGTADAPTVITMTAQRTVDKDSVIDGGGTVTLSGGKATRILKIGHDDFESLSPKITVQHLSFLDGHTTDVSQTKATDHGGAAIYRLGGTLTVVDSKFLNNIGPADGQDVAGGAIYSIGGGSTSIAGSTFSGNQCSSGGALGNLGNVDLTIYNSNFSDNSATGHDANPGNGGNGGAISFDGPATTGSCNGSTPTGPYTPKTISMCGAIFNHNLAGVKALGGALFRTVDTTCVPSKTAPVTIDRSTFAANESGSAGAMYVHQVDLTLTNSTVNGNIARAGNGGGVWVEGSADPGANVTIKLTNTTISGNTAKDGLGGGFVAGGHIGGGEFLHVTMAANAVTTDSGNQYAVFAGGIVGDVTTMKLTSSIIANNQKPAAESGNSSNCDPAGGSGNFIDGGGNIEFVKDHTDPKRCTAGSSLTDPGLSDLADNGGPTLTMSVPAANKKVTASCTATDQRGKPRSAPCAAGAFEPQ